MAEDTLRILDFIARCVDPQALRTLIRNARERSATEVRSAAERRLFEILPQERPGTVEHDFWRTVGAFEHVLSEERGRTTRLARTRMKVARVGVVQTLADWARSTKPTDGFEMLVARGRHDLLGEAIVLRHPDHFDEETLASARRRLEAAGIAPAR